MDALSKLHDDRIDSDNYLLELTIEEYLEMVQGVLAQNEFQRRRVASSKSIYSLLKLDIQRGCVIPPIVLALTSIAKDTQIDLKTIESYLQKNKENLVILDGLQRTYSLVDLANELNSAGDEIELNKFNAHKLRVEVYVGINRLGILYRMLTLNTGQTPMSLRQQIEMLYLDYAKVPLEGIALIREVDNRTATGAAEYNFREIIDGFNSYLERNELPIERSDLLENIKSLEKLSLENASRDIFKDYVEAWHLFVSKMAELTNNVSLTEMENYPDKVPFGKSSSQVFKKAQSISGFGAAVGRLKDYNLISGFNSVKDAVNDFSGIVDPIAFLEEINNKILWINSSSKKIGNAQRMYFQYYFRELLNPESDSYCRPQDAIEVAFQKYRSQTI